MTEDEAKTKWCPFVRATHSGSERTFNRWFGEPNDAPTLCCVGSSCMIEQLSDGVLGHASGPRNGADSHALTEQVKDLGAFLRRQLVHDLNMPILPSQVKHIGQFAIF